MHLFTDYLEPLIKWISIHPNWALLITFIVSFSESVAVLGSLIPGSVTMTAIGILAGSGVMRVDLTIVAAIIGAIAGDNVSYALGYTFRNELSSMWPFNRRPHWLDYGKNYFSKHGGKSVLLGRFIGPLRSITPLIAGMMHMNRWHFLMANIISAIGWSLLYVLPGILIGLASHELSTENASQLFIIILLVLIVCWCAYIFIKWIIEKTNKLLLLASKKLWLHSNKTSLFSSWLQKITPPEEQDHLATLVLLILFILNLIIISTMTLNTTHGNCLSTTNKLIGLTINYMHTEYFDIFFIAINLFIKPLTLTTISCITILVTLYYKDWRTLSYCISLGTLTLITSFVITTYLEPTSFTGELNDHYTIIGLCYASCWLSFMIFFINNCYRTFLSICIKFIFVSILVLGGLSIIYFGKGTISNILTAYSLGITVGLGHIIMYRRKPITQIPTQPIIFQLSLLFLTIAVITWPILLQNDIKQLHRKQQPIIIEEQRWWHQNYPLLPSLSSIDPNESTGIVNLEYIGSIDQLKRILTDSGWKQQSSSFFYTLLMKASGKRSGAILPLIGPLYQNQKPQLIMTYNKRNTIFPLILRLWRSNYFLQDSQQAIWLGSLSLQQPNQKETPKLEPFYQAFNHYKLHQITIVKQATKDSSLTLVKLKEQ
ncbi:MAG: VTT domain-containing protein [Legionella sp.]